MKTLYNLDKQTPLVLLGLAVVVLILPLQWIVGAAIAALIHELGHCCAVYLFGGSINCVRIGPTGATLEASGLTQRAEMVCLLAGPLAGFLTLCFLRLFPPLALCGFIQSLYNLIPIYPLDGGRILHHIVTDFGGNTKTLKMIEFSVSLILLLLCIYILIRFRISIVLLFVPLLLEKHLANRVDIGYNKSVIVQNEVDKQ